MRKRILILKEPKTTIKVSDQYIEIRNILNNYTVSFEHIEKIYLNKSLKTDILSCYKISQKVPLFIIDEHGYILSELKGIKNDS